MPLAKMEISQICGDFLDSYTSTQPFLVSQGPFVQAEAPKKNIFQRRRFFPMPGVPHADVFKLALGAAACLIAGFYVWSCITDSAKLAADRIVRHHGETHSTANVGDFILEVGQRIVPWSAVYGNSVGFCDVQLDWL